MAATPPTSEAPWRNPPPAGAPASSGRPGARCRALAAQRDLRLDDAEQIALHWNGFGGPGAATLLGLQHEAGALIEIDSAGGFRSVWPAERHGAFKCVGVGRSVVRSLVGTRHAKHTTKLG